MQHSSPFTKVSASSIFDGVQEQAQKEFQILRDAFALFSKNIQKLTNIAHTFTPQAYIVLNVRGKSIDMLHMVGQRVAAFENFKNTQSRLQDLKSYIDQDVEMPLCVLLNGMELDFKHIDLGTVRFYERSSLVRQIERSFMDAQSLFFSRRLPSPFQAKRRVFASLNLSDNYFQICEWLEGFKNPFFSVQHESLLAVRTYLKQAQDQSSTPLHPWVVVLRQMEDDLWQVTVMHHQAPILFRQGFLNSNSLLATDLTRELAQTCTYLERFGFDSTQGLSVIQVGFSQRFELPADGSFETILLPTATPEKLWGLSESRMTHWWMELLGIHSIERATFYPSTLLSHILSWRFPRFLCAVTLPLIYFSCIGFVVLWAQSFRMESEHQFYKKLSQERLTKGKDMDKKITKVQLFQFFQKEQGPDVLDRLRVIADSLQPEGVATEVSWNYSCPPKVKTAAETLHLVIQMDMSALKSPKKSKKKQIPLNTVEDYQNKVQQSITAKVPKTRFEWSKNPSQNNINLQLVFPS